MAVPNLRYRVVVLTERMAHMTRRKSGWRWTSTSPRHLLAQTKAILRNRTKTLA
jgi:hypothetical protein